MAAELQRQGTIRTTDLYPEAVIPPPSTRRIAWGPLIVGLLIVITAGVAIAWSVGLTGLSGEPPQVRDPTSILPAATAQRSPYPDSLPDLSGRTARNASVRRVVPPVLAPTPTPITTPPVAETVPTPRPAPQFERIKPIVSVPVAVTPRAVVVPKAKPVPTVAPVLRREKVATDPVQPRPAQPLGGPLAGVFVPSDYPAAARRNAERGDVTVRLAVSRDGRVSGCRILAADASPTLVGATCAILIQRARFVPATDSAGAASEGFFVQHVAWRLP